jgi:hypothetical protein
MLLGTAPLLLSPGCPAAALPLTFLLVMPLKSPARLAAQPPLLLAAPAGARVAFLQALSLLLLLHLPMLLQLLLLDQKQKCLEHAAEL